MKEYGLSISYHERMTMDSMEARKRPSIFMPTSNSQTNPHPPQKKNKKPIFLLSQKSNHGEKTSTLILQSWVQRHIMSTNKPRLPQYTHYTPCHLQATTSTVHTLHTLPPPLPTYLRHDPDKTHSSSTKLKFFALK